MADVDGAVDYELSYFQRIDNFSAGGAAAYVDEFDSAGEWLGGKWLGGTYQAFDGIKTLSYHPTVANVGKIQAHLFTEENSNLTLYIDEVELKKI
jgi:hypothetical protein